MKRSWHQRFMSVAALGLAIVMLAGCTSPLGDAWRGRAAADVLTVTAFDPVDVQMLKDVGRVFERTHPGMRVNVTLIPEDVYVTKFDTARLANDAPDVAYVYTSGMVSDFQPLNSAVYQKRNVPLSQYNSAVLKSACGLHGRLYCVGGYLGAMTLYYNKDMFKAAGVPELSRTTPLTMAQYAEDAKKLTDHAKGVWGGDAESPTYWNDIRTFLDDSGRHVDLTKRPFVESFSTLAGMVRDGVAPNSAQVASLGGDNGVMSMFLKGKTAMVIGDNSVMSLKESTHIDYGIAPVPVPEGIAPWVTTWTNSYGIPKGAKHVDAAADFLALIATNGQHLEAQNGLMPLRNADAQKFAASNPVMQEYLQVTKLSRPSLFTPDLYAWSGIIDDAFNAVTRGRSAVGPALAAAQPKAQQQLDTTWRQFDSSSHGG